MIHLRTPRLVLRNWAGRDRAVFHQLNSDERVMAYFPMRRTRAEADELMDRLQAEIEANGFGFAAVELVSTGKCIGMAGIKACMIPHVLPQPTIEIGWRLHPGYWRLGLATEAASAWLERGFGEFAFPEIVAFTVVGNYRSIAVMERLGMRYLPGRDFDHPDVPKSHPHLRRHLLYRITAPEWWERRMAQPRTER